MKDKELKRANLCPMVKYPITSCRKLAYYQLQIEAEGQNPQSVFLGGVTDETDANLHSVRKWCCKDS